VLKTVGLILRTD